MEEADNIFEDDPEELEDTDDDLSEIECPACGYECELKNDDSENCPHCQFPMFTYFRRLMEKQDELKNNEKLKHLLEGENCEEFMKWSGDLP